MAHPIHFMFGSMVWFSGTTNLTASFNPPPRVLLVAMAMKFQRFSGVVVNEVALGPTAVRDISEISLSLFQYQQVS